MKLWNYITIITGLSILMALAGLDVAGFTDLFKTIGLTVNSSGIGHLAVQNTLWSKIFGTEGLLTLAGITSAVAIGTFVFNRDKAYIILPLITTVLVYWISVLISIINYLKDYPIFGVIIALILIPLTVGFIQSAVDYFMGVN